MNSSTTMAALLIACSLLLTSCFGGDGGGGTGPSVTNPITMRPDPLPETKQLTGGLPENLSADLARVATSSEHPGFQAALMVAASMTPRSGSVTQSSNGRDGVTADTVNVRVADGVVTATKNSRETLGVATFSLSGGDTQSLFDVEIDSSGVSKVLYLNLHSLANTYDKFAAWGIWIENPSGDTPTIGAFADTNSYFPQDQLRGLIGTATYRGTATAFYQRTGSNPVFELLDVSTLMLTAEFGDANALGTVSGEVSARRGNVGNLTLNLGSASIGSANNGFFTGDTSGMLNFDGSSSALTGKWGGQFLALPSRNIGDFPAGLLGTFGGTTADGSESVIGSYQTVAPSTVASGAQIEKSLIEGIGDEEISLSITGRYEQGHSVADIMVSWIGEGVFFYRIDTHSEATSYIHNTNFDRLLVGPFFDNFIEEDEPYPESATKVNNSGAEELRFQKKVGLGRLQGTAGFFRHPEEPIREAIPQSHGSLADDTYAVDANYLTYGEWLYTDAEGKHSFGVFASGDDPFSFRTTDIQGLTGTATYRGRADGLYSSPDRNYVVDFVGTSELTADFGTGSETGTISGSISTTGIIESQTVSWSLGSAMITSEAAFSGDTSGTIGGVSYTGNWGGRFYQNGDTATDHPGAVSGVFEASSTDNRYGVVGSFGAFKE